MNKYKLVYYVERRIGGVTKKEKASMVVNAETTSKAKKYVNQKYAKIISVTLIK